MVTPRSDSQATHPLSPIRDTIQPTVNGDENRTSAKEASPLGLWHRCRAAESAHSVLLLATLLLHTLQRTQGHTCTETGAGIFMT